MARWILLEAATSGAGSQLLGAGTSTMTMGVFLAGSMFLVCAAMVSMVLALCAAHGSSSSIDGSESDCSFHEAAAAGEVAAAAPNQTPERIKLGQNAGSNTPSNGSAAHLSGTLNASLNKMNSFRKSSFRKLDCKQVDVVEHAVGGKFKPVEHLCTVQKSETDKPPPQQQAAAAEESSADSDEGSAAATATAAAAPAAPAVWQRAILRGNRCAPLAFSGLILYDEQGRPLRNFNTDRSEQPYQTHCRSQTIS